MTLISRPTLWLRMLSNPLTTSVSKHRPPVRHDTLTCFRTLYWQGDDQRLPVTQPLSAGVGVKGARTQWKTSLLFLIFTSRKSNKGIELSPSTLSTIRVGMWPPPDAEAPHWRNASVPLPTHTTTATIPVLLSSSTGKSLLFSQWSGHDVTLSSSGPLRTGRGVGTFFEFSV